MVSAKMKLAYDRIAGEYAAKYQEMPTVLAELGDRFIAGLPESPSILDAGCGAGRDMAWFESRGIATTGIDLSPAMLDKARPLVTGKLLEMNLLSIDLPDASFDGIWCMASLLHIP